MTKITNESLKHPPRLSLVEKTQSPAPKLMPLVQPVQSGHSK